MIELEIHSPTEEIHNPIFLKKDLRVFVKRDDMIHPFISGNKWRKLKYLLLAAEKQGKNHLVTFGGAYSNHLLATACAGAKFGFKTSGFVRGEKVNNETLNLCQIFGMNLIFSDRESYKNKKALFENYFHNNDFAFFIDEGGTSQEAIKGCSELAEELDTVYDHLFCAAGTGSTAAGFIKGIKQKNIETKCHVIPVLKGVEYLYEDIKTNSGTDDFEFHQEYHFGGYAKTNEKLITFIKDFCRETGILIEPIYTGKLFFALFDLIEKDKFKKGSKILVIHSGGLTGISGMINKFQF